MMAWDGMGGDGVGWDGMGWDGMGWEERGWDGNGNGMGWHGMGGDGGMMAWDGMAWHGMGREGMGGWDGVERNGTESDGIMGWVAMPCDAPAVIISRALCLLHGQSQSASPALQSRYKKLCYRVVFPMELKLINTTDDCEGADSLYRLFAVVIHVGSGPNHGTDPLLCDQPHGPLIPLLNRTQ